MAIPLLLAVLSLGWAIWGSNALKTIESTPQTIVASHSIDFKGGLPITQGNSLLPISHLPPTPEIYVFAVLVEDKEIIINNYCDWDYLKQWWPEETLWRITYICNCESWGNPKATNYSNREKSVGLFMVNLWAHPEYTEKEMKDPIKNIQAALKIYEKEGFDAWYNCNKQIR